MFLNGKVIYILFVNEPTNVVNEPPSPALNPVTASLTRGNPNCFNMEISTIDYIFD